MWRACGFWLPTGRKICPESWLLWAFSHSAGLLLILLSSSSFELTKSVWLGVAILRVPVLNQSSWMKNSAGLTFHSHTFLLAV